MTRIEERASRIRSASVVLLCCARITVNERIEVNGETISLDYADTTLFKHAAAAVCGMLVGTTTPSQGLRTGRRASR